jgi:predicted MFS family arabinose efflux permease
MAGTIERARGALLRSDFRKLFLMRVVSQFGDGLFQAALVSAAVFSKQRQSTLSGIFWALLVIALPYSLIGPLAGVFIDRWRRRNILWVSPLLRAGLVLLVLFDPTHAAVLFFGGALLVSSVNRFYLATAQTIVPRLVPVEDLLMANSLANVGGTVALLVGVPVGAQITARTGNVPLVLGCMLAWASMAWVASRIRTDLGPPPDAGRELVHRELGRVSAELRDGAGHLFRAKRAVGPITSISLDQLAQGVLFALSLVVFKERFKAGVGSYGWLIGSGGAGVLIGLLTVGTLEARLTKERIVAGAFALSGAFVGLASFHITGGTVLIAAFAVGLTFAWKKGPVDTMVQEAVPDAYRGRVSAVYDVAYNAFRLIGTGLVIPIYDHLGSHGALASVGALLLLWTPVLPIWVRGTRDEEYSGAA